MKRLRLLLAVLAIGPAVAAATEVPLFSNFAGGVPVFVPDNGVSIGFNPGHYAFAQSFTPDQSGYLSSVQIGLSLASNKSNTGNYVISIYADGALGGVALETMTLAGTDASIPVLGSTTASLPAVSFTASGGTLLNAGQVYWAALTTSSDTNGGFWQWDGNAAVNGLQASNFADGAGTWNAFSGGQLFDHTLQVNGVAPVPLPASAWLLLGGIVGLVMLQRRRSTLLN